MQSAAIKLAPKQLFLLGETHGVVQNIQAVHYFVRSLHIQTIFIEVNQRYQPDFQFLKENTVMKLAMKMQKLDPWIFEAGVISIQLLKEYAKLQERGVRVVPILQERKGWNKSDTMTANNILRVAKLTKGPHMVVFGNLHMRKIRFRLKNDRVFYAPIGWLLRDHSVAIQMRYGKGEAYNFGSIHLVDANAMRKLGNENIKLLKSQSKYFDYDILIRKASPMIRHSPNG